MQNNLTILCTRPLDTDLIEAAKAQGIDIEEIAFIETTPIVSAALQAQVKQAATKVSTVAFTSMNAVEAVADVLQQQAPANWQIYCIGTTTNLLVKKYFGDKAIVGTANSAAELATLIANNKSIKQVDFFCGDQRRDELPEILRNNQVAVNEITVYTTTTVANIINKIYAGILFFSPSGVHSFFKHNQLPATTILFAIGSTTANEIVKYTNNPIVLSNVPGKENLVKTMMQYFSVLKK